MSSLGVVATAAFQAAMAIDLPPSAVHRSGAGRCGEGHPSPGRSGLEKSVGQDPETWDGKQHFDL